MTICNFKVFELKSEYEIWDCKVKFKHLDTVALKLFSSRVWIPVHKQVEG